MQNNLTPLIKLDHSENEKFGNFIKAQRKRFIKPPKDTATDAFLAHEEDLTILLKNSEISKIILALREWAYDEFLKEEALLNSEVLSQIGLKFDAPQKMLKVASDELFNLNLQSASDFQNKMSSLFGKYAGNISPYIYQLCLSNTQSRRSRAGKVFEGIIYALYDRFNYAYDSQAAIGKKTFTELKLGKVVDSILPSVQAFNEFRNKTIVGSMKTTLRERWQEVVEEISRSNLPNIYLLTVDEDISVNKAEQMAQHNIVLVVLKSVKENKTLKDRKNIIDFETYFNYEIPEVIKYWARQK